MIMAGPFDKLLEQARRMGEDVQRAAQDLAKVEVTGEAGAGMVQVTLNGRREVRKVQIDPQLLSDRTLLEDLAAGAMNDALRKLEKTLGQKVSGLTGGIKMPGGFPGF